VQRPPSPVPLLRAFKRTRARTSGRVAAASNRLTGGFSELDAKRQRGKYRNAFHSRENGMDESGGDHRL